MTAYLPTGRTVAKIAVPVEPLPGVTKKWMMRSTGTRDPQTVKRMQVMVDDLGRFGHRAWDLLGRVSTREWTLMQLYERYVANGSDVHQLRAAVVAETNAALEARENFVLADWFDAFEAHVQAETSDDTAAHYLRALGTLEDAGIVRRNDLHAGELEQWLDHLATVDADGHTLATGTRRKYAVAANVFCGWLVRKRMLADNPMRLVKKPKPGASRMEWIGEASMLALANAQASPYRELSAFIHGTGLDVSAALDVMVRAIDVTTWSFEHQRPKTEHRHSVVIAEWARPFVKELLRGKLPLAKLGDGVSRWRLSDEHRAACARLEIKNYWLRDARHSWAVRFDDLGGKAADGAEQLGHRDGGVLFQSLYSRRSRSIAARQSVEAGERHRHTG